jgi:hypothetical protein
MVLSQPVAPVIKPWQLAIAGKKQSSVITNGSDIVNSLTILVDAAISMILKGSCTLSLRILQSINKLLKESAGRSYAQKLWITLWVQC